MSPFERPKQDRMWTALYAHYTEKHHEAVAHGSLLRLGQGSSSFPNKPRAKWLKDDEKAVLKSFGSLWEA